MSSAWPIMPDGRTWSVSRHRTVPTIDAGMPAMPCHHESRGMPEDEANALIARVRRWIAECTSREFHGVIADLASACPVVALAIREPPFPELADTVAVVRRKSSGLVSQPQPF
jgi:hypothetical protein